MSASTKFGDCPICGSIAVALVRHHCHLQDVIVDGARSLLLPVPGEYGSCRLFGRHQHWWTYARTGDVVGFPQTLICTTCNEVDGCLTDGRPGPCFSLAPVEIRDVRKANHFGTNTGSVFVDALAAARQLASRSYFERAPFAFPLGAVIARE